MAADFWTSSHCTRWLFDSSATAEWQTLDRASLPAADIRDLRILFSQFILSLSQSLELRQRVAATAVVYFKRFYCVRNFVEFDPVLVAVTCVYLASKVEESTLRVSQVVKAFHSSSWASVPEFARPIAAEHVLQCEWFTLEALDCDLIVFHPYRPLLQYAEDMRLPSECLQSAWSIVNDAYLVDAPLFVPPFIIALAALSMACVLHGVEFRPWFERLNVNEEEVAACRQNMLTIYRWASDVTTSPLMLTRKLAKLRGLVPALPAIVSASDGTPRTVGVPMLQCAAAGGAGPIVPVPVSVPVTVVSYVPVPMERHAASLGSRASTMRPATPVPLSGRPV